MITLKIIASIILGLFGLVVFAEMSTGLDDDVGEMVFFVCGLLVVCLWLLP